MAMSPVKDIVAAIIIVQDCPIEQSRHQVDFARMTHWVAIPAGRVCGE